MFGLRPILQRRLPLINRSVIVTTMCHLAFTIIDFLVILLRKFKAYIGEVLHSVLLVFILLSMLTLFCDFKFISKGTFRKILTNKQQFTLQNKTDQRRAKLIVKQIISRSSYYGYNVAGKIHECSKIKNLRFVLCNEQSKN